MKKFCIVLALLLALAPCALAKEIDLSSYTEVNGQVTAPNYVDVVAPYTGTLMPFTLKAGDPVTAGTTLFEMRTTVVTASESGTVTSLYIQPGDSTTGVITHYGSLGTVEPTQRQRINCSTSGAYSDDAADAVSVGQKVYFKSSKGDKVEGSGVVISMSGTNFVVEVTDGSFEVGEVMTMYLDSSRSTKQNVGKGSVTLRDPISLSGSGVVSEVYVQVGDKVENGTKLFSLMSADADRDATPAVTAPSDGIVANVAVSSGQQVWKGEVLARIYLTDVVEVVADVDEMDLHNLKVGDSVYVKLDTDNDNVIDGIVSEISYLGTIKSNATYYTVHVRLQNANGVMLNQSANLYLEKD